MTQLRRQIGKINRKPPRFTCFLLVISMGCALQWIWSAVLFPTGSLIATCQDEECTTYHSSEWEKLWLENIDKWQNGGICEAIANQQEQVHIFMNDTCTARTDSPWCLIDDSIQQIWYHTGDGRVLRGQFHDDDGNLNTGTKPNEINSLTEVLDSEFTKNRKIWSWFERKNTSTGETTYDYIEPLVSHLRHPLARCGPYSEIFLVDRSFVLPGKPGTKRTYLFDSGASSWYAGAGGPSLSYFAEVWRRFGFSWDAIEAWEGSTSIDKFSATVPSSWKNKTTYHNQYISTSPSVSPFVPSIIRNQVKMKDYAVFKLDIDSKAVETAIVDYMLGWKDLNYIDEFLWEHHVSNYLMARNWGDSQDMTKSIADSYQYFLKLRQKGVRAHSWV
jgi:hypothetical protein